MSFQSGHRRLIRHVEKVHGVQIIFENTYAELDKAHRLDHERGLANHATLIPFAPRPARRRRNKARSVARNTKG